MARLFVLDALGLAYRAYYAFIRRPLLNSKGENTSAMFGIANVILRIRNNEQPDYWALAWDGPGPTERHDRFADYKAHRKPMPDDLRSQLSAIEDIAQALGLPVLEQPGLEADDVMGTLAHRGDLDGIDVALVTSDKDLLQLVSERVRLFSPASRGEDYNWVGPDQVREMWGVDPNQIRDVLALMGDSSDNVPGVPGVGEKTAVELISQFGTFDAMYERLGEVKRDSLRKKLGENRELALLSRDLVTVRTDCPLNLTWDDLRVAPMRRDALLALAQRYGLQRLERIANEHGVSDDEAGAAVRARPAERRGSAAETPAPGVKLASSASAPAASAPPVPATSRPAAAPAPAPVRPASVSAAPPRADTTARPFASPVAQGSLDLFATAGDAGLDERIARLHEVRARAIHGVAIVPVLDGDDARRSALVGLALAARDGTAAYVPLGHLAGPNVPLATLKEWLAPLFADPATPKVGADLKAVRHTLEAAGFALEGLAFDVHIASFLCDPERGHDIPALARDVLGVALPERVDPPGTRGKLRPSQAGVGEVAAVAEATAAALFPIALELRGQLESREQWALYERLEHPLIPVLADMEAAGIRLDRGVLDGQGESAGKEIARLETELLAIAGEEINLNSGPQLARILFEKLKLKPGRRTKTGFSTDQAVLEELAGEHAFPARLLEYRALTKLKSTYFDALPLEIDPRDGRIHTTFEQTGAATGRLSSSRPNLQNIPMRSPLGREIRRAFVAAPGHVLVGGDYSQIELRVMAHLSGDANLIEAFTRGEDVHASTARRVFGVAEGPLDPALRSRAKIVNFGVIYGMGARSLSQQMGITLAEAQEFIKQYFEVYSGVRDFLDRSLAEARQRGYAITLFGRRRYLPGLTDGNGGVRSLAERVAVNTPIQGSAADLMKLAMIRVHAALKRFNPSAKLLLQVHDELLLEVPEHDAAAVEAVMRKEMEQCFPLRVPLEVTAGHGGTWLDAH